MEGDEQYRVLKFLMRLSYTYTTTRGQILMMEPQPSVTKVFNLVSQEKRQWSMKHDQATSAVAFQASQVNQQSDSVIAADYGVYNKQKNRPIYSHCGIACHTDNRCYKLHGYPTSW